MVNAIPGAIDILAKRPFQAEHAIKPLSRQVFLGGPGEGPAPLRACRGCINRMKRHIRGNIRPGLGEQVNFVTALLEASEQSLQVKLGPADSRVGAAYQS